MKKIFGLLTAGVMAATMALCTACGVDKDKVKGDWIVDTIGGKSEAEFAEGLGAVEGSFQQQITINDEKATVTGAAQSKELTVTWRSNGVELKDGDTLMFALELDTDKNVLKCKEDLGTGSTEDVVFKKGTFDFSAVGQAAEGGEEALAEGEEAAEGGEEAAEGEDAAAEGEEAAE